MRDEMRIGPNKYDFAPFPALIPSGQFTTAMLPEQGSYTELAGYGSVASAPSDIYNLMSHPGHLAEFVEKSVPSGKVGKRLKGARVITEAEGTEYGEKLVEIATSIRRDRSPHCVIAPLRGALKPARLLEVVGGLDCVEYLPFQNRTNRARWKAMQRELASILIRRSHDRESLRVVVVDTAIGGYGAQHLTKMILEAHGEAGLPHLDVTFHLLHDTVQAKTEAVARIEDICSQSTNEVRFIVYRHGVPSLIVEDWGPALGIELRLEGEAFCVKSVKSAGVLYLRGADEEVRELETNDLSLLLLQKMGEFTSEAVRTDPRFVQTGEVWRDYLEP